MQNATSINKICNSIVDVRVKSRIMISEEDNDDEVDDDYDNLVSWNG